MTDGPQGPGFYVMAECCDECLYGKRAIVDGGRREEIQHELSLRDNYFICHKASIAGKDVACRGDFNARGCGQIGRIMGRLGLVRFINEEDLDKLQERRP